jgi:hypothetical protein
MGNVALAIWSEIKVERPLESLNGTEIFLKERWNPPTAKEGTAGCRAREINNEPSLLLRDWIGRKSLCAEESRLNISNRDKLQQLANRLANSTLAQTGSWEITPNKSASAYERVCFTWTMNDYPASERG